MVTNRQSDFREATLFLSAPGIGELRLQWIPAPVAERRLALGKWMPYQPEFRLLAPETPLPPDLPDSSKKQLQAKYEAFRAFRAILDEDQVKAVEPFTSHQWPLMTLLNRSDAARDMVKANPVLTYALANNEQLRPSAGPEVAATQATRYSRRKQREILGWLGFPDTEAMARLFKKVPVAMVYPGLFRILRQCCCFPEILKIFGHLPKLNTGVIFLASHPDMAPLLTSKLIREVAESPNEEMAAPTADLLNEIIMVAQKLGIQKSLRPFGSRRAVEDWHGRMVQAQQEFNERISRQDQIERVWNRLNESGMAQQEARQMRRLAQEYNELEVIRADRPHRLLRLPEATPGPDDQVRQKEIDRPRIVRPPVVIPVPADLLRLKALVFPPPPIPGTPSIVPLGSFIDFEDEATAQVNCVGQSGAYADRVMMGELYVYRVLAPHRHTLSIVKRGSNCWQVGELRRAGNKVATQDTWIAVQSWLDANQISL
jgi:hypothetical protein